MIVFENRVRIGYRSARRIELDRKDNRRLLVVALVVCLVVCAGAYLLDHVSAAELAYLAPLPGGDISQGAILCADCHNQGAV